MIAAADAADLPALAALLAGSALLQRYRVTLDSALQSLKTAQEAGDLLLVSRHHAAITGLAWLSFAPRVLNAAAYLRLRPDVDGSRVGAIGLSVGGEMLIHAAAHSDAFAAIRGLRWNRAASQCCCASHSSASPFIPDSRIRPAPDSASFTLTRANR